MVDRVGDFVHRRLGGRKAVVVNRGDDAPEVAVMNRYWTDTRDPGRFLAVSKQTISTITDRVIEGMAEWQSRPLDSVYPVIFIDAVNVKIRDGNVANRPIYIALAVTVEGTRDILGLWAGEHGDGEGAKFWARVLSEIKNRGTQDVCMVVCDGLKGLPAAIETVWPQAITQTCVVHYSDTWVMPTFLTLPLVAAVPAEKMSA
jgi:hypothetical protein